MMGYKFQFITLAGFHTQNIAIFELYKKEGMTAYLEYNKMNLLEKKMDISVKPRSWNYFDSFQYNKFSSTTAMEGSTESEQF